MVARALRVVAEELLVTGLLIPLPLASFHELETLGVLHRRSILCTSALTVRLVQSAL